MKSVVVSGFLLLVFVFSGINYSHSQGKWITIDRSTIRSDYNLTHRINVHDSPDFIQLSKELKAKRVFSSSTKVYLHKYAMQPNELLIHRHHNEVISRENERYNRLYAVLPQQDERVFIGFFMEEPFTPSDEFHFIEVSREEPNASKAAYHPIGNMYVRAFQTKGDIRVIYHFPRHSIYDEWTKETLTLSQLGTIKTSYLVWNETSKELARGSLTGIMPIYMDFESFISFNLHNSVHALRPSKP